MGNSVEIVVDNRLKFFLDELPREISEDIRTRFEHSNPEYYKIKSMGYKTWNIPKVIKTWDHEKDENDNWVMSIPRGGFKRLTDVLDKHQVDWSAVDERSTGEYLGTYVGDWVSGDLFPDHRLTLWDHQVRIVDAIEKYENCLVRAPTGSGKSISIIAAMTRIQLSTIIIVWSTALLKQWVDCINEELDIPKKNIGIIQGKKCRLKPVTVAMQQTLNRYTKQQWNSIRDVFGFVAADEVQKYAAATFTKTIDQFNSKYRIGVSADETRKDKKEFLIYDMFGRVAEDISKKELVDKKLIHDVEVLVVPTDFKADWYRMNSIKRDRVPDFKRLVDEMIVDPDRNEILRRTISQVAKKKYRMLVFSQRVDHCKRIDTLVTASGYKSGLLIGGVEFRDLFDDTKNGLIDGSRQIGIGTLGGGSSVGLDLPQVSHGVLATPIHNNKQFLNQVTGRLCRIAEDKKHAQIYILWDQHVFGKRPLTNFRKWFSIVKVLDGSRWVNVDMYLKGYRGYEEKEFEEQDSIVISADKLR